MCLLETHLNLSNEYQRHFLALTKALFDLKVEWKVLMILLKILIQANLGSQHFSTENFKLLKR